MKIHYFADTDSMMIELNDKPSHETVIINDDINLDFDEDNNLVAIDIHNNASKFNLNELVVDLPKIKKTLV